MSVPPEYTVATHPIYLCFTLNPNPLGRHCFTQKLKTMLKSQLRRTLLVSNALLFITAPAVSFRNDGNADNFSQETISTEFAKTHKVLLNKNVKQFVKNYIRKNNECLYKIKRRNIPRFLMMDSVFKRYRLPVELKYLAVVESELKPRVVSRAGAAGPWQLMPKTARIFGLKISRGFDERTDYDKSTKAAVRYLKDLYTEFGDWLLVLAAYNGGPAPVYRAIHKSGSRNFWKLQSYLPAESSAHVKKFIATHYYFEGQGSVTTLTKAERLEYTKAMGTMLAETHINTDAVSEKP